MKRLLSLEVERTLGASVVAVLVTGLLFTLGGCSGTTDDPAGSGGSSAATSGAATTAGGTGGATVAPASGGTAGSPPSGSAGAAPAAAGSGQALVVNCTGTTYQAALSNCTVAGCHGAFYPESGMNLTPDDGLVGRLKDAPAKHEDIVCDAAGDICTPATCPPPGQALLVDSADYTQSWILKKIGPADPMCGDQMPGGAYKTSNDMACIQALVQAIASLPK